MSMSLTEALSCTTKPNNLPGLLTAPTGNPEQIAHHEAKEGENIQKTNGTVLFVVRISAALPSAGYVCLSRL